MNNDYENGYLAGKQGKGLTANPNHKYMQAAEYSRWEAGWWQAFRERTSEGNPVVNQ